MADTYLPAAAVRARYQVCDITIKRWMNNPRMNFPGPALRPNSRSRLWKLSDIEAWEASRTEGGADERAA
jgi:hypothetical protein